MSEKLKKYTVTTAETRIYYYEVEAKSDDESDLYSELEDDKAYDWEIESTEIINVEEIKDDEA